MNITKISTHTLNKAYDLATMNGKKPLTKEGFAATVKILETLQKQENSTKKKSKKKA